ncbi:Sulfur globule protein CV3 family protein [Trichostrongylus colubriformis]|uniref:Sulfur globule protein CV3 family protein n=1 Tax=Trichostrongylus colubriformis TaxID=6319 RepID=A0AAN8ICC3_TRICO
MKAEVLLMLAILISSASAQWGWGGPMGGIFSGGSFGGLGGPYGAYSGIWGGNGLYGGGGPWGGFGPLFYSRRWY